MIYLYHVASSHLISSHLIASRHIPFLFLKEATMKPGAKSRKDGRDWIVVTN